MRRLSGLGCLVCAFGCIASGSQLLTNGGFDTGTLAGWTVANQAGSFPGGSFFASNATTTPQSANTTVGPATGLFYALSDSNGAGAHALLQTFTVPTGAASVILSFSLFVNSYGGNFVNPIGLDFTGSANQHGRVDLLTSGATALSTTTGVLQNFYLGTDAGANPHAYTNRSFDITSLVGAGGTFQLRFAEVDNQNYLNMGVDNVSIDYTAATGVPEPGSVAFAALGLAGLAAFRSRRPR